MWLFALTTCARRTHWDVWQTAARVRGWLPPACLCSAPRPAATLPPATQGPPPGAVRVPWARLTMPHLSPLAHRPDSFTLQKPFSQKVLLPLLQQLELVVQAPLMGTQGLAGGGEMVAGAGESHVVAE